MEKKGALIVISGFSGAGKGTLVKRLLSDYDRFALSISMTTRAPREGEEDGREYFFVSRETFEKTIAENGLLEHAEYCGNYYGTPKAYVESKLSEGVDVILEIEVQGAFQIKKIFPEAVLFFVTPPSAKILEERLRGRGTESDEVIRKRLLRADEEAELMEQYDYVLVNDSLEECIKDAVSYIDAAKATPLRNKDFINQLKEELDSFSKGV
ncbi:MAG: guanylate kinase [Lachnospiraceae bacterium]|nr:guanylate kinase [Lachnospiraceae bacterium]